MAITGSYNTVLSNVTEMYRATNGGTVFSANIATSTTFDYFDDTAVPNDALYFSPGANGAVQSDLVFNVGTAMAGTGITLVWEYYKRAVGWVAMECVVDDTVGFTVTGINRVKFPIQWRRGPTTMNGLYRMWTRCRLVSRTTITEGGANTTNRITSSNGKVTIAGGTDAVPATFTDLYNWCVTNIPYVTVSKTYDQIFDFTKIAFEFTGRCYTTNEIIQIGGDGEGSQGNGQSSLNYVTSGEKIGNRGVKGSTFIVNGIGNSAVLTNGSATKLYGVVIKSGKYGADGYGYEGYHYLSGENIDCFFELSMYMTNTNSVENCRLLNGIVIAGSEPIKFTGNTYICTAGQLFYLYSAGFTLRDFSYQFKNATATLFLLYQVNGLLSQQWNLVNPGTPIGKLSDPIKGISISNNSTAAALSACKFYDSSAGTYTDYTTQASNTTPNDVPLSGDVGDYYLFGFAGLDTARSSNIYCEVPNQTNDYIYAWEVYVSGNWVAVDPNYQWDATANFTKTGGMFTAYTNNTQVTIDGVSAKWMRARIVTKGTTSPVATQIRQYQLSAVSKWSIKEQWSVNLKVVDVAGTAISGASITASNGYGSVTVTTDANGAIAEQILTSKEWHFDPINNPTTFISENLYPTFNLSVSKAGYETYTSSGNGLSAKIDVVIALKPILKNRQTIEGKILIANKPELGSSSKMVEV